MPVRPLVNVRRILVRATNWVGDAVMSIPALQALRVRFPDAHISILARPWVAGLYGREPFCDELIPFDCRGGAHDLAAKRRLAAELRRQRFDCAILLQNAFEAAALVRLAGIPLRIGYGRDARGWLLTRAVAAPLAGETPPHQRFYYLELLKRAGLIATYSVDDPIRLSGSAQAAERGRAELIEAFGNVRPVIGVSPGAAYGGAKRWLPERFAESAARLARERNAAVAVFGSREELATCEIVRQLVESAGSCCISFAGRTSIAQFVEMAAACELFLTNDSGPMHIASALGIPTVTIFGATDEIATGPTGPLSRIVREPVECSPCLLRECPIDHRCMTRVTSERVVRAASELVHPFESSPR